MDIECLIQEAFLLCHPEPCWQIVLPSQKRMKCKGPSWFHRERLSCPSEGADELREGRSVLGEGFFYYKNRNNTLLFLPKERKFTEPSGFLNALLGLCVEEEMLQL